MRSSVMNTGVITMVLLQGIFETSLQWMQLVIIAHK